MIQSFKEKVILIAGEVNTLSKELIHSFLKEEATVIFPANSLHQIDTIKSFRDVNQYKNLVTLIVDVEDFDKVKDTCENIAEKFGTIDIAIQLPRFSNAGKTLTEASMDEWNNMMEIDMLPFFMGARIVLNLMKGNLNGMFVHISDSSLFEGLQSCALARVAFTTRIEMSKIFAEEAHRNGIRYYHLWAQDLSGCTEASKHEGGPPAKSPEMISKEIMDLYEKENYSTEMAFQSFPKKFLHPQT